MSVSRVWYLTGTTEDPLKVVCTELRTLFSYHSTFTKHHFHCVRGGYLEIWRDETTSATVASCLVPHYRYVSKTLNIHPYTVSKLHRGLSQITITVSHPSGCQAIHPHEVVQKIGELLGIARLERDEVGAPPLKFK